MHKTIFTYSDTDSLGDILEASASVTRFLMEISPALVETKTGLGLSDDGVNGLQVILESLHCSVEAACVLAQK